MGIWRLLRAEFLSDPAFNFALDRAIAEHVGRGEAPPTVRLWRPGRCLALGRFETRLPRFEEAIRHVKAQKIAVIKRLSGGGAVWQDEGYLNFSVIAPNEALGVPEAYKRFSQGVILGLQALGVECAFGHIEGAFCDGPYDLTVGGKKLVGTAQVQKRDFIIVHGTMLVAPDLDETLGKIQEFYERAGSPLHLRREVLTSLAAELGRAVSIEELIEALCKGFRSSLGVLEPGQLLPSEMERARQLTSEIVL